MSKVNSKKAYVLLYGVLTAMLVLSLMLSAAIVRAELILR